MTGGPDTAPEASIPQESAEELYEGAPFGYLSVSPDGLIVRANRTVLAWTGYPREDVIGRLPFRRLLTPGGRIFHETHLGPLLRMQGCVNEIALDVARADGTAFPALLNGVEVRDGAGRLLVDRITLIDATDRRTYERELLAARRRAEELSETLRRLNETLEDRVRAEVERRLRAEEQLHQAQKLEALGRMAGGVAHDVNNLLGAILGNVEVALRFTSTRGQGFLKNAIRGVERGEALTQRLVAFSRRRSVAPTPVDVHLVTEGLRDLLERSLGSKARLRTAVPESLPPVLVDVEQFEVALMNLAVNAGHAMPAGGAFTVSAQLHRLPLPEADPAGGAPALREPLGLSPGPYLRVLAEDEGVGMDAETLARAAEPFFTTKPVGQGSGFGLAMVQGFAEQSGGRLVIESEPGRGTRVAIWLPAADGGTR